MRYDAVAFLEGLFGPTPSSTPSGLPPEWRELYEERAAILEYDGGAPREVAEHYALIEVLELMKTPTDPTKGT